MPRADFDPAADHEAGQKADAELANHLGGFARGGQRARTADRGEEFLQILARHAQAVVAEDDPARLAGQIGQDVDAALLALEAIVHGRATLNGVMRVLDQLADEDLLFAVQMPGQQLDQAVEVERHFPARDGFAGSPFCVHD
jgi:hypothetical protein